MDFNHRARVYARYIGRVRTLPEGRGDLAGGLAAEGRAQAAAAAEAAEAEVGEVGAPAFRSPSCWPARCRAAGEGVRPDGRPAPMPAVARLRGGWSTRQSCSCLACASSRVATACRSRPFRRA